MTEVFQRVEFVNAEVLSVGPDEVLMVIVPDCDAPDYSSGETGDYR